MKTIRSLTPILGLFLALYALGTIGARGQLSYPVHFAGTFTLPFEAQWGGITLPAGNYTLRYGFLNDGHGLVVVRGAAKGSPHGMILAGPADGTSAAMNAIVCIREGNALFVRSLDMPAIGKSTRFRLPRGAQLTAHNTKHSGYTQLAEAPELIQRIPVTLNVK